MSATGQAPRGERGYGAAAGVAVGAVMAGAGADWNADFVRDRCVTMVEDAGDAGWRC